MADMIDDAQQATELNLKQALYRRRAVPNLTATGFCFYCDEPVELPRRWCDAECRDEWQRENQ